MRTLERLHVVVLTTQCHQAWHLMFGQADLLAAEIGQRQVGDLEVDAAPAVSLQLSHVEPSSIRDCLPAHGHAEKRRHVQIPPACGLAGQALMCF